MYKQILTNLTKLLSLLNAASISKLSAEIKQNLTTESKQNLRYHLRESNTSPNTARLPLGSIR